MKQIFSAMLALAVTFAAVPTLEIIDGKANFKGIDYVARDLPGDVVEGVKVGDGSLIVPASKDASIVFDVGHHRLALVGSAALDPLLPQRIITPVALGQVDPTDPTLEDLMAQLADGLAAYNAVAFDEAEAKTQATALLPKLQAATAKRQARADAWAALLAGVNQIVAAEGIE